MRGPLFSLIGFLGLMTLTQLADAEAAQDYGILIISRERLEVATPCEIGIYLQDELVGRLFQEQSTSFNLPPGSVSVGLRLLPGQAPGCAPGMSEYKPAVVTLHAGEIRKYRIAAGASGLYLKAAPQEY